MSSELELRWLPWQDRVSRRETVNPRKVAVVTESGEAPGSSENIVESRGEKMSHGREKTL